LNETNYSLNETNIPDTHIPDETGVSTPTSRDDAEARSLDQPFLPLYSLNETHIPDTHIPDDTGVSAPTPRDYAEACSLDQPFRSSLFIERDPYP
jgi:hypothetical protein